MEKISLDLFTKYSFLSGLHYSQEAGKVLFVETKTDMEKNDYQQRLHTLDTTTNTVSTLVDWKKNWSKLKGMTFTSRI